MAEAGDQPLLVNKGTVACIGTHMNSLKKTHYRMANLNDDKTITITRLQVFDKTGVLKKDYPAADAFPSSFNAILAPHSIMVWHSEDVFADTMMGPLQVIADFSIASTTKPLQRGIRGLALQALSTFMTVNPTPFMPPGLAGQEMSRSDEGCSYTKLSLF